MQPKAVPADVGLAMGCQGKGGAAPSADLSVLARYAVTVEVLNIEGSVVGKPIQVIPDLLQGFLSQVAFDGHVRQGEASLNRTIAHDSQGPDAGKAPQPTSRCNTGGCSQRGIVLR